MFIVREVSICGGGRKRSDVFFPAKNLRNVPWEVVDCRNSFLVFVSDSSIFRLAENLV